MAATLALAAVVAGAVPAAADGPTTFASLDVPIQIDSPVGPGEVQPATPYPSTVTVSGLSGPVQNVELAVQGLTHQYVNDIDMLLVAPTGQSLVVMSDADDDAFGLSASGASFSIADGGAPFPTSGSLGSGPYRPTNLGGPDVFPAPAPPPSAATTFAEAFSGADPNGDWSLYVVDDLSGDDGVIQGWSLTITTAEQGQATTTSLSSSANPSRTGEPVTVTALVQSDGQPVTEGSVSVNVPGMSLPAQPVDAAGMATFSVDALPEGSHQLSASYSGSGALLPSTGSLTQQVDNNTVVTENLYCNPGDLVIPDVGPASVYPSRIFVEEARDVAEVQVRLNGLSHTHASDIDVLLAGPDPADNLLVLSDVPGAPAGIDLTFSDDGAPLTSLSGSATAAPTDLDGAHDTFPAPAPSPSEATTLSEAFTGTPAAGAWTLFVVDNAPGDSGTLSDGWCLDLTFAQTPTQTVLSAPEVSDLGDDVEVTATITSADGPVTTGSLSYTLNGGEPVTVAGSPDAAGEVSFTLTDLPRGAHMIGASYTGAGDFADSAADPVVVQVQSATALEVQAPETVATGAPVPVSVEVGASDGPVTAGVVSYRVDGGEPVEAGVPDDDGIVPFTVPGLDRGEHTLEVSYAGAEGWTDSEAAPVTVLAQSQTTITLDAPAQVASGSDVTVTASVREPGGEPVTVGSVAWSVNDGDMVQADDLDAQGDVTFTLPALSRGVHTVNASYTGTDGYVDSVAVEIEVLASSATTLTLDAPDTVATGADFVVTATVSADAGETVDAGSVSWSLDGGEPVAAGTPVDGVVTFDVEGLSRGEHTLSAIYAGDDGFDDSTAEPVSVWAESATSVEVQAPETVATGADVPVAVEIGAGDGPVTAGTIRYRVDGGDPVEAGSPDEAGQVEFTLPGLERGEHTLEVLYSGAEGWTDSAAESVTILAQSQTTITLDAPTQVASGSDVTVTASVREPGGTPVTAGRVDWSLNQGEPVEAGPLDAEGDVQFTVSALPRGTHTVNATYTGTDGYVDSVAVEIEVLASTATTLTLDAPQSVAIGEDFSVTARVSAGAEESVDAGVVAWSLDGGEPVTAGTPVDGVVTFDVEGLSRGEYTLSATYTGADGFEDASAQDVTVLAVAPTQVLIEVTPEQPRAHEPVFVSATVLSEGDQVLEGTVRFSWADEVVEIGAGDLPGEGVEIVPVTTDPIEVVVEYLGAPTFGESVDTTTIEVELMATNVVLSAPSAVAHGQELELSASVSAEWSHGGVRATAVEPGDAPPGTVRFTADGLELGEVSLEDGQAVLFSEALPPGIRTVTAEYLPSEGFAGSDDQATIEVSPVASAGGPYSIAEGEDLTLLAGGPGAGVQVDWDLTGDGEFSDASGSEVDLSWAELEALGIDNGPASYLIEVRFSVDGLVDEASAEVEVLNAAPTAQVEVPARAVAGEPVTIEVSATDPSSADMAEDFSYRVDWGDGSSVTEVSASATGASPSHSYAAGGTFVISVVAIDRDGAASEPVTASIAVDAAPEPTPEPEPEPEPTVPGTPPGSTPPGSADDPVRPGPSIPSTGVSAGMLMAIAAAMLIGGTVLATRRRTHLS
ncbi:Ig-like domain repeat protein [Bogoriella caseilytica]|uniref:Ig-like domain repeat protein n=1 Tax=Bogoriella caseilytica TaxID=56055 RepID=UPI0014765908|nr:Ig-like domain repeat protein [Bogoriella caseilytica]